MKWLKNKQINFIRSPSSSRLNILRNISVAKHFLHCCSHINKLCTLHVPAWKRTMLVNVMSNMPERVWGRSPHSTKNETFSWPHGYLKTIFAWAWQKRHCHVGLTTLPVPLCITREGSSLSNTKSFLRIFSFSSFIRRFSESYFFRPDRKPSGLIFRKSFMQMTHEPRILPHSSICRRILTRCSLTLIT